jgi:hypothetical protein
MDESLVKRSFASTVMVITYCVDVTLILVESLTRGAGGFRWHETITLALIILIVGKLVDISLSVTRLERENSPWKEQQAFLDTHSEFAAWIRSVVASRERAEEFGNSTFQERLKEDLENFRVRMEHYGRGYIENVHDRLPVTFYRFPEFFARDTTKAMLATCMVERAKFWDVQSSTAMVERQGQLKKSNIDVMRIFLETKARVGDLRHAIELHQKNGVPVAIALIDDDQNPVPESLQKDFMVVDEDVLIRQEMRQGKLASTRVWMGDEPAGKVEIGNALRDFDTLRREYALPAEEAFKRAGVSWQPQPAAVTGP